MRRLLFIFTMLSVLSPAVKAQDDMYFGSSKKKVEKEVSEYGMPRDTYYAGSSRSVDEYNRRKGYSYEVISSDSTMNDVINFSGGAGVYPDSTADFNLTRQMSRWEGYTPTDAYWQGYDQGRSDEWAASTWHSPWYYSSYYYPWYNSWYDPWYYDRWYWHRDPWYYHHHYWNWAYYDYGYHHPGGGVWRPSNTRGMVYSGTKGHSINRGNTGTGRTGYSSSRNTVGRSVSSSSSRNGISYGNARSSSSSTHSSSNSSSFGNARSNSNSSSFGSTRNTSGNSGASFGSSRSSGSSGGFSGSRGGGGGGRSGGRR